MKSLFQHKKWRLAAGRVWWQILLLVGTSAFSQQITIPRVNLMPDFPQPYHMRNWKKVALGYDSLVFNFHASGQYLPLIRWNTSPVNYPNHPSFGLHTVVGTLYPESAEAINALPAVIGAMLCGVDKRHQFGQDFVLMCEEWFNRRPAENVYLNHPYTSSGSDWWYDTMPNLFFYQLFDLASDLSIGEFALQFELVADRWLEALGAMGGSATPWNVPGMNYHGWHLSTMTPNTNGVPEPEAAGAIAWLLYMAWNKLHHLKYRTGVEWALEFLEACPSNPSYELQLPYGAYVAARMNAEVGTTYDIPRLVNWCFDVGPLRNWGAIVGTWGGYDCSGLIGEISGNDYAFFMNTVEQIGALVPLVRYDERFATAIGKWVLNATNALRLFYPNFLPDDHQDNEQWAHQYDPHSCIAYEALREEYQGYSPYATGDAMSGGWGLTNLTLYGSSHVGILGAIVDTTNIPGILKLDVLKTDYFHRPAYPTYLLYNPYSVDTLVALPLPTGNHDIYEVVSNQFVQQGVSGTALLNLPAHQAWLVVLTPAGGALAYRQEWMLVNGVVVDFRSGQPVSNYPPRIKGLAADPPTVGIADTTTLFCTAVDRDGDSLTFQWTCSSGNVFGSGSQVQWVAPGVVGQGSVRVVVSDGLATDTARLEIPVTPPVNHPPVIESLTARPRKIDLGGTVRLQCTAYDPDGDSLSYDWTASAGILQDSLNTATWTAPMQPGDDTIYCRVVDSRGAEARDSIVVLVRDFSQFVPGKLIAYYPMNGNANDASGHGYHGVVHGAVLTTDRFGNPNAAYRFDGVDDYISVANHDSLNFRRAISLNFWMKIDQFSGHEAFLLSHGSWQHRWKVSLIPSRHLRWTVNTDQGIVDLDSENPLQGGIWYNVTCYYDGSGMELYLNGELDNFTSCSGLIRQTSYDLTMGQMLPGNASYNFAGVLDEVRVYNYGLSVPEITTLYQMPNGVTPPEGVPLARQFKVYPNYPNPFNSVTVIQYTLPHTQRVEVVVFDVTGQRVAVLMHGIQQAGRHTLRWQADNLSAGIYFCRVHSENNSGTIKMLLVK